MNDIINTVTQHIEQLRDKEPTLIPYGGGNPYYYCSECQCSNVEGSGHYDYCSFNTKDDVVASLELLLEYYDNGDNK
jgi:hypothetical protein